MEWLTILPPVIAITVVVWKKEVILALFLAILSSELLLAMKLSANSVISTPINTIDRIVNTAASAGTTSILIFSLLVGALLAFIRDSGGVSATVNRVIGSGLINSKKRVGGVTMFTGMAIFIESNLSVLTAGIFARGLFDKYKMSRARLAYIIDSTCAPICILILLNGWGAYILALISTYDLGLDPLAVLWGTLPFNVYAWLTLVVVGYTIFFDKVHGPMKEAEDALESVETSLDATPATKSRFMLVPLLVMIIGMFGFMFITGDGDITKGSGSKSVLYATFLACVVAYILLLWHKRFTHQQSIKIGFNGMGELLPLVTIVLLSIALGSSLRELGTGIFVSGLVGENLPLILVVPMLFIAGAIMSFTTGTSWGTFAILIPIGMPLVATLGLPPSLVLAAILGGGIFGDHCSPISDTTAISSLAAGCDLLTHVKTQMPYALSVGGATIIAYILLSLQILF
ncbi:Na+/H+ antiporter NhaC family protein [Glaciecola sp. MF2-115]|uniref:Na+/H+ antiporter NhaC family protein n=1 Tax=Glaciecola sp. MF2-115 TaxID=3384827 RepID=UPI0039A2ED5E